MRQIGAWIALAAVCALPALADAHGGQYAPPPYGPPGPRNPARDPHAPTAPPPSRNPDDVFRPSTPGGDPPPEAETPAAHDAAHWTRWWYANRWRFIAEAPRPAITGDDKSAAARDEAASALVAVLTDPNEDLASGAAVALGRIGGAAAVPPLLARLRDRAAHPTVREAAALGLGLLPRDADGAAVRAALDSVAISGTEPERLRAMAVYALGARGDAASGALFRDIGAGDDAPLDVVCAARTAVGMMGGEGARADLEGWLAKSGGDDAATLRVYAAHGLARLGDASALPALWKAAKDRDPRVRAASIAAIGAIGAPDDETVRVLTSALRDDVSPCRCAAALALGATGDRHARAPLEEALRGKDGMLRCHAALGLGLLARRMGDATAAGAVALLLPQRSDRDLRGAAALACGLARMRTAVADLRAIAQDSVAGEPRAYAAIALGMLGDRESIPTLRSLARDTAVPEIPWEAATALGLLGDAAALDELRAVLDGGDGMYAQGNAAVGIGRLGGPAAARVLVAVLRDEKRPGIVRGLAAVGIGLALGGGPLHGYGPVAADLPWPLATRTVAEIASVL
jgi:HEAT repeat protein